MNIDWDDVFRSVSTESQLITASEDYIHHVIEKYNMNIDTHYLINIRISTNTKRTAGHVKYYSHPKLNVGLEPKWGNLEYDLEEEGFEDIRDCELMLSWNAFEEFDAQEWKENIRHELIHIEELQAYGDSHHGWRFKARAEELDTGVSCSKFTEYNYELYCSECNEFVAGRYNKSKIVKNVSDYNAGCCNADLYVKEK
jgi:predicted SprT family Zn-dependent metalloprotease